MIRPMRGSGSGTGSGSGSGTGVPPVRRATTLIEFTFIAVVFFLLVFGILEYCRYVFLLQVANNAAREGARYAIVRTGDGTTTQDVIDEVTRRMAGREKEVQGYTVEVLNVDPNTGQPIAGATWQDAAFGNAILVRITGEYNPLLPSFLFTAGTIPVRVTSMMSSEAN